MESTAETTVTEGIGAQVLRRGVRYRLWAPDHETLAVVVNPGTAQEHRVPLTREADGYFAAVDDQGAAGDLYLF